MYPLVRLFIFSFICLVTIGLTSCAMIFNTKHVAVNIHTNERTALLVDDDTVVSQEYSSTKHSLKVMRTKKPLHATVVSDSSSKTAYISSTLSGAYAANFLTPYLCGFLIDLFSNKRFTYPSDVYIDLNNKIDDYMLLQYVKEKKIPKLYPVKNGNVLKITPLKLFGMITPAVEFSYERRLTEKFSAQVQLAYLLHQSVFDDPEIYPNIKGYQLGIESRYYFSKQALNGSYLGLEGNYLKKSFDQEKHFLSTDEDIENSGLKSFTDVFHIQRQAISFNMKYGYQYLYKRLCIDSYIGVVARYRDVRYDKALPQNFEELVPRHPNIPFSQSRQGKYWVADMVANIKVGFSF